MNQNKKTSGSTPDLKPSLPEQPSSRDEFKPKTAFGRELWALRQKAVAEGMTLMTNEEILAEIDSRR